MISCHRPNPAAKLHINGRLPTCAGQGGVSSMADPEAQQTGHRPLGHPARSLLTMLRSSHNKHRLLCACDTGPDDYSSRPAAKTCAAIEFRIKRAPSNRSRRRWTGPSPIRTRPRPSSPPSWSESRRPRPRRCPARASSRRRRQRPAGRPAGRACVRRGVRVVSRRASTAREKERKREGGREGEI